MLWWFSKCEASFRCGRVDTASQRERHDLKVACEVTATGRAGCAEQQEANYCSFRVTKAAGAAAASMTLSS